MNAKSEKPISSVVSGKWPTSLVSLLNFDITVHNIITFAGPNYINIMLSYGDYRAKEMDVHWQDDFGTKYILYYLLDFDYILITKEFLYNEKRVIHASFLKYEKFKIFYDFCTEKLNEYEE